MTSKSGYRPNSYNLIGRTQTVTQVGKISMPSQTVSQSTRSDENAFLPRKLSTMVISTHNGLKLLFKVAKSIAGCYSCYYSCVDNRVLDRLSDLVGSSDQTEGLLAAQEPQCESDFCVHLGQLPLL